MDGVDYGEHRNPPKIRGPEKKKEKGCARIHRSRYGVELKPIQKKGQMHAGNEASVKRGGEKRGAQEEQTTFWEGEKKKTSHLPGADASAEEGGKKKKRKRKASGRTELSGGGGGNRPVGGW